MASAPQISFSRFSRKKTSLKPASCSCSSPVCEKHATTNSQRLSSRSVDHLSSLPRRPRAIIGRPSSPVRGSGRLGRESVGVLPLGERSGLLWGASADEDRPELVSGLSEGEQGRRVAVRSLPCLRRTLIRRQLRAGRSQTETVPQRRYEGSSLGEYPQKSRFETGLFIDRV